MSVCDYTVGDTINFRFTTRAFATGIPTTLAGTPVLSVMEDAVTTPITAGVSVAVDQNSVTGLNLATIVATGGNGFEAGKEYDVYISTGTVGGVSVVGEVVGHFTLSRSAAAVDLANGTDGLGALKTLIDTVDDFLDTEIAAITAAVITNAAGADIAADIIAVKAETVTILVDTGTTLDDHLTDIKGTAFVKDTHSLINIETYVDILDDGTSGNAKIATDVAAALVDTNELQTDWVNGGRLDLLIDAIKVSTDGGGAGPWTTGAGTGLTPLGSGTAQSGTASTIVLAVAASFGDDVLNGNTIKVTAGTGAGQARLIISNTLADDTCNIAPNWTTNPSSDSVYEIVPGSVNVEAISLDNGAANNLELDYDGTGYAKANSTIGTTTTNTDMRGTDSAALATALATAQTDLDTITGSDGVTLATAQALYAPAKAADIVTGGAILVSGGSVVQTITVSNIPSISTSSVNAIWDALTAGMTQPGSAGEAIKEILVDTGTTLQAELDGIQADTEDIQTQIGTAGAGLTDLGGMSTAMKAEILVEVNAALDTAISELPVAIPTATPTARTGLMLLYMALRDRLNVSTSGTPDVMEIHNDAGTVIAKKQVTDSGGDYSEAKMESG